jgi:exocyst complex protein 70, putative
LVAFCYTFTCCNNLDNFIIVERDRSQLKILAEWLCLNRNDDFIATYANLRCEVLEKSLKELRHYQNASSGGSSYGLSSPAMGRKNVLTPYKDAQITRRTPRGIQQALKKKLQDVIQTEMLGGKSSHFNPNETKDDISTSEKEIEYYLTSVTVLYKLLQYELKIMQEIVPLNYQKLIFSRLATPALEMVVSEGESIANRVKKCTTKHDFSSCLNLFPILRHQTSMRHSFDMLFEGCTPEVQSKFQGLVVTLQTTINRSLEEFIDHIKNDQDIKLPKDGTVHELTSNVMLFVVQLLNYVDVLSRVITVTDMQSLERSSDKNRIAYAQYITRVLSSLGLNLQLKSESYSDVYLKAIFRLNNIHYILKVR